MNYPVNHIVDYVGNGELCLGLVVKDQGERIQVQGPTKQVTRINVKQVVADYGRCPTNNPLPTLTSLQNEITAIQEEIDTSFFWESLMETAPESRPLEIQGDDYFGQGHTPQQRSALGRALMADSLRFRFDGTGFAPNPPEEIQRLESLRRQRAEKAALRERTRQWLAQAIGTGEEACRTAPFPVPQEMEPFLQQCTDYLLRGLNSPAVNLLSTAGSKLAPRELALSLLRKTQRMPKDADEFLLANGIHAGFSPEAVTAAESLPAYAPQEGRETIQGVDIFSIDDQWTREIDDALSWQRLPDGSSLVGIHLANPSSFVKKGDLLDQAAVDRPLSLYLPTTTVTMFPERLGCDLASLNQGETRPAFSVMVTLDDGGEILDWRIAQTQLAITRRLTYIQADELLRQEGGDSLSVALRELRRLAECRHRIREECGAVQLNRPEVKLHVQDGKITAEWDDQNTPSHDLVSEFMVLANHLAARYALRNQVPIIYRCQELPADDVHSVRVYDPIDFDQQVRKMKRTRLSTYPEAHGGLGLDLYTQISSPLRRYADMVIQRQLCAHLDGKPLPYSQTELFGVLDNVDRTASANRALEREARAFWTLELLRRQEADRRYPATVVRVEGRLVLVELNEYLVRGILLVRDAPSLGETLLVRIQEVKPKLNRLVTEPA